MLALNATIEATRAAAAGKGFAELDRLSQEIAAAMAGAMGEMQFQDVIRQRLESVIRGVTALKDAGAETALQTIRVEETVGPEAGAIDLF